MKIGIFTILFSFLAVSLRCIMFIISPLYLDYFKQNDTSNGNTSHHFHGNSAQFFTIGKAVAPFLVYSIWLAGILILTPSKIGQLERNFPKKYFLIIGSSQGLASVLFTYSISGSRTPAYLQGILANGHIPVQHITRFIILQKKPTIIKVCCAITIIIAVLVCLIPIIFPSLESSDARRDDGGATGIGRILWPLLFISSIVPFAICNTVTEKSVQTPNGLNAADASKLNLVYFQFWRSLFVLLTVGGLFWTDIIPGLGTSKNWNEFKENFQFDFLCLFGAAGCPSTVIILAWSCFFLHVADTYTLPALIRYSEGANFMVVVLSLRMPIVFLFWSLFDEQPFHWHPHAHLGTWLSIGAIVVILPAVVLYDMGDKLYSNYKQKHAIPDYKVLKDEDDHLQHAGGDSISNTNSNAKLEHGKDLKSIQ